MKSVELTIKWKINHILECLHDDTLKDNKLHIGLDENSKKRLSDSRCNDNVDEICNDWIYDSCEFPLLLEKYSKYEEITINNDDIYYSTMKAYPALSNAAKKSKKYTDYLVVMNNKEIIKCIKASNVKSVLDVANILTFYFNHLNVGDFNALSTRDDISVLVCKKE